MASTSNSKQTPAPPCAELRQIPVSQIVVREGLNPRGEVVQDDAFHALVATIRERGCLQSLTVRVLEDERFLLFAGERRYRAAVQAGLQTVPASIRPLDSSAQEEADAELATEALIENELRVQLNPLQRATAYQQLLAGGLSVRGVAERLGGSNGRAGRERRIKEHLAIRGLPEDLRERVGAGEIPLIAVKALVGVAKINEQLARQAVAAVLEAPADEEPYTWAELVEQPLSVALSGESELPEGVFMTHDAYPLERFNLSEQARKDLAAYERVCGRPLGRVAFTSALVEQVRPLGCVHEVTSWKSLVVGQEVGDRLAEDYIAGELKAARAQARRARERERAIDTAEQDEQAGATVTAEAETPQARVEREAVEAKQKRERERAAREAAHRYNQQLGVLAFKALARVKVDERVLRILASVDLGGKLAEIAARGARLSFPGWVSETRRSENAKPRPSFLEKHETAKRASAFLDGADTAADVAGRCLLLVALASLVDEHAVAQSNRSFYELRFDGPFAAQAQRDLNAIVRERIKEGQLPELDQLLAERAAADQEQTRVDEQVARAAERLQGILERVEELGEQELEQAIADAELAWGHYALDTHRLRTALRERQANQSTAEDAADPEPAGKTEPIAA